jgi:hypothetical protein
MHFDFATFFTGGMGALLLSAAARALPEPIAMGNPFYAWVYRFAHLLLANFDKANWRNEDQPSGN